MAQEPFMEHPDGQFTNAVDAMEAAIERLRGLPEWNNWITFCAQGEGESPDNIAFAELRLSSDILEVNRTLELRSLCNLANVPIAAITQSNKNRYSLRQATAKQVARVLDAIFRHDMHIRPFEGDGDDYSVGAEW
jgi:hypothetical protein